MSKFEGPRGLIGYARVETAEQQTVEVQQSSAILAGTIKGAVAGPFVWLRVARSESATFAHLTVDDAREVRDALSAWLADFGGEQDAREPSDRNVSGLAGGFQSEVDSESTPSMPSDDEVRAGAFVIDEGAMDSPADYPLQAEAAMSLARDVLLAAQQVRRG